tara:strand:+ start:590 stop:853 length:264 start_codon:yes stop_codon:yes gene_type:complete
MAYNMKGSPMQRNFGIGSPVKKATDDAYYTEGDRVYKKDHGRINFPEKDKMYQAWLKKQETKKYLEEEKKKKRDMEIQDEDGTIQNF